jgi:hypothetical protein
MKPVAEPVEIWKKIPGFKGYEASNFGRVRSSGGTRTVHHPTCGTHQRNYKPKVLSPRPGTHGYSRYDLGAGKFETGQRAVFLAFNGSIKPGNQINHINSIRKDNRIENLESISPKENFLHCLRSGRRKQPVTKEDMFSKEDVLAIRFFYDLNHSEPGVKSALSKIFKCRKERLRRVSAKETYWWICD